MTDNQTCYVCEKPCRPGAGLTDDGGRRHIKCPVPDPGTQARRRLAIARARSVQQDRRRMQAKGIRAEVHSDDSER